MASNRSIPDRAEVVIIGGGVMGAERGVPSRRGRCDRRVAARGRSVVVRFDLEVGRWSAAAVLRRDQHRPRPAVDGRLRAFRRTTWRRHRPATGRLPVPAHRPRRRRRVRTEHGAAELDGGAQPDDVGGRGRAVVDSGQRRRCAGSLDLHARRSRHSRRSRAGLRGRRPGHGCRYRHPVPGHGDRRRRWRCHCACAPSEARSRRRP